MASVVWTAASHLPQYDELHRFARVNKQQCKAALLVYLDMTEAKNFLDVGIHHSDIKKITYFSGRESHDAVLDVFIPIRTEEMVTINWLHLLFNTLIHPETQRAPESIIAAIVDDDSTIVYYRMYNSIVPPSQELVMTADHAIEEEEEDFRVTETVHRSN